jgi:hypothetical protein
MGMLIFKCWHPNRRVISLTTSSSRFLEAGKRLL